MSEQDPPADILDVFLCHNSKDKLGVREIAQRLSQENIISFLDESKIAGGKNWHAVIGEKIKTAKSAAVFFGPHGVGQWQSREIIALLNQSDKRDFPVIPVILASDGQKEVVLPWSLEGVHCVDFRADPYALKKLIWAITGQKPAELSNVPSSEKPGTMEAKVQLFPYRTECAVAKKVCFGDPEVFKKRYHPPLTQIPKQAPQLEIFRRRVMKYWVEGVLKRSLYNEVLNSLGMRRVDDFVDPPPWEFKVEVADTTNTLPLEDRNVSTICDATGLLLILGEPGSGKSTTLLNLARILLDRARKDIRERVPIILNLSSWKKRQPLTEWISGELHKLYRVDSKIFRLWLRNDYLIPLLDGLDEVKTSLQPDCVAAINEFIENSDPSGLVVCCRFNEYRWLPERLKLNGAIRLEELSDDEVAKYFTKVGPKLTALCDSVSGDPVLRELAKTPLMLNIMSLAFQGAGSKELGSQKGDSLEERRKQIFTFYVEKMFKRDVPISRAFPKEKLVGCLSWLAGKMREDSQWVFLLEELQPSWLDTNAKRGAYRTVVALSLALIGGMSVWLSVWQNVWLNVWISVCLGVCLGVILLFFVFGASANIIRWLDGLIRWLIGDLEAITLLKTMRWDWKQFHLYFFVCVFYSVMPLVFGCLLWILHENARREQILHWWEPGYIGAWEVTGYLKSAILLYLACCLSVGLIGGLIGALSGEPGFTDSKAFPNQGITLSGKISLFAFLVIWLSVGLIGGLLSGLAAGLLGLPIDSSYCAIGLVIGIPVGLGVALNRGGSAVIKHYALRLILWLAGYTPLNFVKFLDDCVRLLLLNRVERGYTFIHPMLLDYFADLPTQAAASKSASKREVDCCI